MMSMQEKVCQEREKEETKLSNAGLSPRKAPNFASITCQCENGTKGPFSSVKHGTPPWNLIVLLDQVEKLNSVCKLGKISAQDHDVTKSFANLRDILRTLNEAKKAYELKYPGTTAEKRLNTIVANIRASIHARPPDLVGTDGRVKWFELLVKLACENFSVGLQKRKELLKLAKQSIEKEVALRVFHSEMVALTAFYEVEKERWAKVRTVWQQRWAASKSPRNESVPYLRGVAAFTDTLDAHKMRYPPPFCDTVYMFSHLETCVFCYVMLTRALHVRRITCYFRYAQRHVEPEEFSGTLKKQSIGEERLCLDQLPK